MIKTTAALLATTALALLSGCATTISYLTGAEARFDDPAINESSALVESPGRSGVFWTLNDSGGRNEIYAVDLHGRSLATYTVTGATSVDWESMAVDDKGNLYVGDIGNNSNNRRNLVVYRFPEPDLSRTLGPLGSSSPSGVSDAPDHPDAVGPEVTSTIVRATALAEPIRFHYPDQNAFPDPKELNFDAEALFWADGALYILTKHRSDARTTLYRFSSLQPGNDIELVRVSTFDTRNSMVTGADVTSDGRYLAMLTYFGLYIFERPTDSDDYLSHLVRRIPFDILATKQCEGVAWSGSSVIITNEQGEIHVFRNVLDGTEAIRH